MKRTIATALATLGLLAATVTPAHAGLGGVRYLGLRGTVTNGVVTWQLVNYWRSDALTSSTEHGAVRAPFLRTTTVTDPTRLAPGECHTLTVTGRWLDGHPLVGNLTATVCAPTSGA